MTSKRVVAGLFVAQMVAVVALAQDAPASSDSAEFNRVSGGSIELMTKDARKLSGTLGVSMSKSSLPFAGNGLKGYDATLGGTILQDRLWFFAAATQQDTFLSSGLSQTPLPDGALTRALDAKLNAQIGDRQNLAAYFNSAKYPFATSSTGQMNVIPASFLSLHYTGIVSSNMFFNASFSRSSVTQPGATQ